mmetsp:Transcript_2733/g.6953  ORF Transcript_2733/g.6953 Transcript_2733/m.6953 type:complete len:241 (+) Transcript_2733:56-778(+)
MRMPCHSRSACACNAEKLLIASIAESSLRMFGRGGVAISEGENPGSKRCRNAPIHRRIVVAEHLCGVSDLQLNLSCELPDLRAECFVLLHQLELALQDPAHVDTLLVQGPNMIAERLCVRISQLIDGVCGAFACGTRRLPWPRRELAVVKQVAEPAVVPPCARQSRHRIMTRHAFALLMQGTLLRRCQCDGGGLRSIVSFSVKLETFGRLGGLVDEVNALKRFFDDVQLFVVSAVGIMGW